MKRKIFAVLAAAWCGLIFYLSSQPGDESSRTSGGFINFFCELIVPDFSGFSGAGRAEFVENLQFIVRKCAHMGEYAILFWLGAHALSVSGAKHPARTALIVCVLYASGDEFHQCFSDGRGPSPIDVMIDTVGASAALGLRAAALHIRRHKKGKPA